MNEENEDKKKRKRCTMEEIPIQQPLCNETFMVGDKGLKPTCFVSLLEWFLLNDNVVWYVKNIASDANWQEYQRDLIPLKIQAQIVK
jgi:hypothetical protein